MLEKLFGEGCELLIKSEEGEGSFWTDVTCVKGKKSWLVEHMLLHYFQGENLLVASFFTFFFVWSGLGDALLYERASPELVWFFYGEKSEETLESRSFVPILDVIEEKK